MHARGSMFMVLMLLLLPWGAGVAQPVRYGQVILPGGQVLHVEVADTPIRRQLGYMFREQVGPEDGMIFLFEETAFHSFWMKNVSFPLDILWLADDSRDDGSGHQHQYHEVCELAEQHSREAAAAPLRNHVLAEPGPASFGLGVVEACAGLNRQPYRRLRGIDRMPGIDCRWVVRFDRAVHNFVDSSVHTSEQSYPS